MTAVAMTIVTVTAAMAVTVTLAVAVTVTLGEAGGVIRLAVIPGDAGDGGVLGTVSQASAQFRAAPGEGEVGNAITQCAVAEGAPVPNRPPGTVEGDSLPD